MNRFCSVTLYRLLVVSFVVVTMFLTTGVYAQIDFWVQTNGPYGGTIYAIAINTSGHIFAGTWWGGVYRSTDNGNNWTQVNTGLMNTDVRSLAIKSSGEVFAGTGGGGVYRSTDNGNSWTQINTGLTNTVVNTLVINSSGDIFAGTWGSGVFRSAQSTIQQPVSVEEIERDVPSSYRLSQNYPNPFNPSTTIEFALPKSGFVTLNVFNHLGQKVAALVSEELPAGRYNVEWDAQGFASGIYFYRMTTPAGTITRKMVLLK